MSLSTASICHTANKYYYYSANFTPGYEMSMFQQMRGFNLKEKYER